MTLTKSIAWLRRVDERWHRSRSPDRRRVLFNARTAMNYSTMEAVIEELQRDPRLEFYFTASENPALAEKIYSEARKPFRIVTPTVASLIRFDAYIASDFLWVQLPRGTRRVQTFHGVAGKYRSIYDSPTRSMREWDRLFFINRRRLRNFVESGAIDDGCSAARLIGMPKLDCLVNGSLKRDEVLQSLGINPSQKTVLYAPTWSPYSSLGIMGEELVERLCAAGYAVIVKLHDRSLDPNYVNSGGVDWGARLTLLLKNGTGVLAEGSNCCPYLAAADILITDHSSVGFEYLLLDRPLIRIHLPELIEKTDISPEYVELLARASMPALNVEQAMAAVELAFAEPRVQSETRQAVASEMFYKPGTATARAVSELYDLMDLDNYVSKLQCVASEESSRRDTEMTV